MKQEIKYCPNCLGICEISAYSKDGWKYGCQKCEVLLYSPSILLDTPDKEKSANYRIKELLRSHVSYFVDEEKLQELVKVIKEILLTNQE